MPPPGATGTMMRTVLTGQVWARGAAATSSTAIATAAGLILLLQAEDDTMALFSLLMLASMPVGASLVMGAIAAFKLHAACKQCIGIYVASALIGFVTAPPNMPEWRSLSGPVTFTNM